MKPMLWKTSLMRSGAAPAPQAVSAPAPAPEPEPSPEAAALAEKIAATNLLDWLFEPEHCHYAPGGRTLYSTVGLTLTYTIEGFGLKTRIVADKPCALFLGPQDNMREATRCTLPGGDADLLHVARAIKAVEARREEALEEAARERQRASELRAAENAKLLLDQFTPEDISARMYAAEKEREAFMQQGRVARDGTTFLVAADGSVTTVTGSRCY